MKYVSCAVFVSTALLISAEAVPCAMFTLVRDGQVLFANNEDWYEPGVIWFQRGRGGDYGRVNVGFDDDFAQGSMNEAGLAFDSSALNEVPWQADPDKNTPRNLLEQIMNECATVEEVLAYFERYNCTHLAKAQFMFADATGDAAIVAWLPDTGLSITRIEDGLLLMTNTRLEASGYRCPRFMKATQVLGKQPDAVVDTAAEALEAIHQHGPQAFTSYSTIYDLKTRTVYLYNLADFSEAVTFDLTEELERKRRHVHKMAELIPNGRTVDAMKSMPQRTAWDTRITLDSAALQRYAGVYSPVPDIEVRVETDGKGGLTVHNPGQEPATLFPETQTTFRIAPDRGQVSFDVGPDGTVKGFTLHKQQDIYAGRIDE